MINSGRQIDLPSIIIKYVTMIKIKPMQGNMRVPPKQDLQYEAIIRQIEDLDKQNQKLVAIADSIMKTSFLKPTQQLPAVITQVEEGIKSSFNALIESVREFFIQIDEKLKQIGNALEERMETGYTQQIQRPPPTKEGPTNLESLVTRITILQDNLKKTQENETKLISIIEGMANKTSAEEQPTILKYSGHLGHMGNQKTGAVSNHQTSFRLFSLQAMEDNPQNFPQQNRPYVMIQSQVSERLDFRKRQPTPPPNMPFCMPNREPSMRSLQLPKRSLKGQSEFEIQNSNRIHRLSYMMKVLKD